MGAPAISILCPAYRTERYLPETLESVLAQTRPDWELVLVDNGLSDAVVDVVARYGPDPRIRLLRQENRGMEGGFATAAAAATGRYVLPLCSDDLLAPTACARFVAVLDARQAIDVLACDADVLDDARGTRRARSWLRSVGVRSADPEHRMTLAQVVAGHDLYYGAAFRRAAWAAGGGYADGNASDLGLFLRLLGDGADVRVLPERLGVYRVRGDSLSRDVDASGFDEAVDRVVDEAVGRSADPAVHAARAYRSRRRGYLVELGRARRALRRGEVSTARAHARRAVGHRVTPRGVAVLAGLVLAPRLLRAVHPAKQRVQAALRRTQRRRTQRRRPQRRWTQRRQTT